MASPRRIVTERFVSYAGDSSLLRLSAAIRLVDQFLADSANGGLSLNGTGPLGRIRVKIRENRRLEPVVNPSGHFCFVDLSDGAYTVQVLPDPAVTDWYPPVEAALVIENGRLKQATVGGVNHVYGPDEPPLVEVRLAPKPAYPFPATATLLRTLVKQGPPDTWTQQTPPVVGASVAVEYQQAGGTQTLETQTDSNGDALHYFLRPTLGTQPVAVRVEKNGQTVTEGIFLKTRKPKKNDLQLSPDEEKRLLVEGETLSLRVGFFVQP